MLKTCKTCKLSLPVAEFYEHKFTKDGRHTECRKCAIKRAADNKLKWLDRMPPEERNRKIRGYALKSKFGISQDEYDEFLKRQNGKCAICNESSDKTLAVDHCHATGRVRGLLCRKCNPALGGFRDSPELLAKAIEYLGVAQSATDPCKIG